MKSVLFLYNLLLVVLFVISCDHKRNDFILELDDSAKQMITQYVKENNIDVKARVITTDWVVSNYRTDIYITNSFTQLNDTVGNVPTYYSILADSIVVFVYTGLERISTRNNRKISLEIEDVLDAYDVKLKSDRSDLYHEPRWLYTRCNNTSKLLKETSPLELLSIPCGYMLLYDTLNTHSYIVKERTNKR